MLVNYSLVGLVPRKTFVSGRLSLQHRDDPIAREYYKPLRAVEKWSDAIFLLSAALSLPPLIIDSAVTPKVYAAVEIAFGLTVLISFGLNMAVRLYWSTQAQENRYADFLSNCFGVPLIHNQSQGFYSSRQLAPFKLISANLLENCFFGKQICQRMLVRYRIFTSIYLTVWLVFVFIRATDLGLIAVAAQMLFSEQVLSRWLRLEWLRVNCKRVYDELYTLVQTTANTEDNEYVAHLLRLLLLYETGKSKAGVSLSSTTFAAMNRSLSAEWNEISTKLSL